MRAATWHPQSSRASTSTLGGEQWKPSGHRRSGGGPPLQAIRMPRCSLTDTDRVREVTGPEHVTLRTLADTSGTSPRRRRVHSETGRIGSSVARRKHLSGRMRSSAAGIGTSSRRMGSGGRGVLVSAAQREGGEGDGDTEGVPERGPPHRVLGVSIEASADEIRSAFRAKACPPPFLVLSVLTATSLPGIPSRPALFLPRALSLSPPLLATPPSSQSHFPQSFLSAACVLKRKFRQLLFYCFCNRVCATASACTPVSVLFLS